MTGISKDGEGSALRREVQDQNQDWKTARAANFPKWDITCFFASAATWPPFKVDEYTPIKISQTKEAGKYLYKVNIGGEEVGAQSDIFLLFWRVSYNLWKQKVNIY